MFSGDDRKRWLLIVDDDPEHRLMWRDAAERAADFRITEAGTYEVALEVLEADGIDIMVTDLFLTTRPDQGARIEDAEGLKLIEHCRRRTPRSRIIAITYQYGTGIEIGAMALEAGADDFISANWRYIDYKELLTHKLRIFERAMNYVPEPTLS